MTHIGTITVNHINPGSLTAHILLVFCDHVIPLRTFARDGIRILRIAPAKVLLEVGVGVVTRVKVCIVKQRIKLIVNLPSVSFQLTI